MYFVLSATPCVALIKVIKTETLFRLYIYTPVTWSADQLLSWSRKREVKQKTLNFVVPAHFKNVPPKK